MAEKNIPRKKFLQQAATIGAASMIAPKVLQAKNSFRADKKTRAAVIGCGNVSEKYLPHLSANPYTELVCTCDIIPERAQKAAAKYNIPHSYPNIGDMIAYENFDLLVNLTDMQAHGMLNKQALQAGRNVWSESPLANSYSEASDLYFLAKKNKVRIWSAPAAANSPQFAFMAQIVKDGKLGDIVAAHAYNDELAPLWSAFYFEKGGGCLNACGVNNLTMLTGIIGPVRSVMAMTSVMLKIRKTGNKGEIKAEGEDNATVLLDHGNGVFSHLMCGFNYFNSVNNDDADDKMPAISIIGKKGRMHLIGDDQKTSGVFLATHDDEKGTMHAADSGNYTPETGASVVAESLVTGKEPRISMEHALHVLEIVGAAKDSQSTGKRIILQSGFQWPMI